MRARTEQLVGQIWHVALSSWLTRLNGMEASVYLVGRVLVDTGFVHAQAPLLRWLEGREIDGICLTHHHEDHSGSAGAIASIHRCPVYLRRPEHRFEEGLAALRTYRQLWWGEPVPYEPVAMPTRVKSEGHRLRPVAIPGHSTTHTALFDESTGVVFCGDLYVTGGVTGIMSHENPFQSIQSLRTVAELGATWMLTGHARAVESPSAALRAKADAIEHAADQVLVLHAQGIDVQQIVRALFPHGQRKDRRMRWFTGGEFGRENFVRACIAHAHAS